MHFLLKSGSKKYLKPVIAEEIVENLKEKVKFYFALIVLALRSF